MYKIWNEKTVKLKCQPTSIEQFPGIELNVQSFEIVERFCYLGSTIFSGGAFNSVTTIKNGWSKFTDLSPLLSSRGLTLWGKSRIYSGYVYPAVLYVGKIWPNKEVDLIRLDRSDARIVRWMCNVRPEDKVSAEEPRNRLLLNIPWQNLERMWKRMLCLVNVDSVLVVVIPQEEV